MHVVSDDMVAAAWISVVPSLSVMGLSKNDRLFTRIDRIGRGAVGVLSHLAVARSVMPMNFRRGVRFLASWYVGEKLEK